jgi:hypothetical protein
MVKINNAEIEQRIKRDDNKWEQGLIDPFARAKYMDKALRVGITAIGRENTFQGDVSGTLLRSALGHSMWTAWFMLFGYAPAEAVIVSTLATAAYENSVTHGSKVLAHKDDRRGHPLPPRMWSLGEHKHYDRLAIAHGYAATTRLIAAT